MIDVVLLVILGRTKAQSNTTAASPKSCVTNQGAWARQPNRLRSLREHQALAQLQRGLGQDLPWPRPHTYSESPHERSQPAHLRDIIHLQRPELRFLKTRHTRYLQRGYHGYQSVEDRSIRILNPLVPMGLSMPSDLDKANAKWANGAIIVQ
jgi:hypothetical protein